MPELPIYTCAYCGKRNKSVAMHSGVYECNKCWEYRKMDGPAASHWAKVGKEFLSNIDLHDWLNYLPKQCGLTRHQIVIMLEAANVVTMRSRYLNTHGPEHKWSDEVKAEFDKESAVHYTELARITTTLKEEEG